MTGSDAASASGETSCLNCRAVLSGAYCPACGQKGGEPPLHFHDFVHELVHEYLHFDSKIWRTLKLLVISPGTLTHDLIAGRRARYVGPIRLFLLASAVLFGFLAFSANRVRIDADGPEGAATAEALLAEAEAKSDGDSFQLSVLRVVRKAVKDPARVKEAVLRALSRSSFLLVPIFALVTWRLFAKQLPFYVGHLWFALHFHAFAFLVLCAMTALTLMTFRFSSFVMFVLALATLAYFYVALRRALQASWLKTVLAGSLVLFICSTLNAIVIVTFIAGSLFLL